MYPHIEYPMIHAMAPELCGSFDSFRTHSRMHIEWLSVLGAKFDIQNPDAAVRCRPNNNDDDEDIKISLAKGESNVLAQTLKWRKSHKWILSANAANGRYSGNAQLYLQLWLYLPRNSSCNSGYTVVSIF